MVSATSSLDGEHGASDGTPDGSSADEPGRPAAALAALRSRWWRLVGLFLVGAFAVRVLYASRLGYHTGGNDSYWYTEVAKLLVDGHGFVDPAVFHQEGRSVPTAAHPPGYAVALTVPALFGKTSTGAFQVWAAIIGTGTVALVACAARRLAGDRAGLAAAAIGAVYPWFWLHDTTLMSENLAMFLAAALLVAAYRFWDRPTPWAAAAVGALIGVMALTRSEALLLIVLLALPLAGWQRAHGLRQRTVWYGVMVGALAITVAPWAGYNVARFDAPVYIALTDHALIQGNCPEVFDGPDIGTWTVSCVVEMACPDEPNFRRCLASLGTEPGPDLSETMDETRRVSLRHVRNNLGRMPAVVLAREGRTWSLFAMPDQMARDGFLLQHSRATLRWSYAAYYGVAAAAVGGVVVLRRRGRPVFPLAALAATVTVTTAVAFGETRYRAIADVALVVAAAVAIDALARRHVTARDAPGDTDEAPDGEVTTHDRRTSPTSPGVPARTSRDPGGLSDPRGRSRPSWRSTSPGGT